MSSVMDLATREERPPYVRFERKAIENVPESQKAGHWVGKDTDFVKITPAYTKDVIVRDVDGWFKKLEQDRRNGRIPDTWIPHYKRAYEAWKSGQEPPVDGIPIRGWLAISQAQQELLTSLGILTVEDLAGVTEDAMRRIGMGAVKMKNLAVAALKAAKEQGPLVLENADLKARLALAEQNVETLSGQLAALKEYVRANQLGQAQEAPQELDADPDANAIAASDLMDEDPAASAGGVDDEMVELKARYREKFGESPRGRITKETILKRLAE